MQVRKFEARSMKEALDMIRAQLGPDAIILSAKDNSHGFGLVGQGSVEVTAAISESTLKKKQFVESRLKEKERQMLVNSNARVQKQVIQSVVDKYQEKHRMAEAQKQQNLKYIDIQEDENTYAQVSGVQSKAAGYLPRYTQDSLQWTESDQKISALQSEIQYLKKELQKSQNSESTHASLSDQTLGEFQEHYEKLRRAGLSKSVTHDMISLIRKLIPKDKWNQKPLVQSVIAKCIMNQTFIADSKKIEKFNLFFGPSGAGKTTTIIKLAAQKVIFDKKNVAIVSCDSKKIGAFEQIKLFSQILNVPFLGVRNVKELSQHIESLQSFDYVLIDTPAAKMTDLNEISEFNQLVQMFGAATKHLVVSAVTKDSDLSEIGKRFRVLKYDDAIFTGLDLATEHGNIFNFTDQFKTPIFAFGIGSNMPEDFEYASKERVLDLIFKLTKVKREQEVDL